METEESQDTEEDMEMDPDMDPPTSRHRVVNLVHIELEVTNCTEIRAVRISTPLNPSIEVDEPMETEESQDKE